MLPRSFETHLHSNELRGITHKAQGRFFAHSSSRWAETKMGALQKFSPNKLSPSCFSYSLWVLQIWPWIAITRPLISSDERCGFLCKSCCDKKKVLSLSWPHLTLRIQWERANSIDSVFITSNINGSGRPIDNFPSYSKKRWKLGVLHHTVVVNYFLLKTSESKIIWYTPCHIEWTRRV